MANNYQIWSNGYALPMHRSKDLNELIQRAKRLGPITGQQYEVRNKYGVVWRDEGEGTLFE